MPGRSFGLGKPVALAAASSAKATFLWITHSGKPVAAAAAVHLARKERREMWNVLLLTGRLMNLLSRLRVFLASRLGPRGHHQKCLCRNWCLSMAKLLQRGSVLQKDEPSLIF